MLVNNEVMKFKDMTIYEIQEYIRNVKSDQELWTIALYFTHSYRLFWIKKKKSIAPFEEIEDYLNRICEITAMNFLKHFVNRKDRFFLYSNVSKLITLALHTVYKTERKRRFNQRYLDFALDFCEDRNYNNIDIREELTKQLKISNEKHLELLIILSHHNFRIMKTAKILNLKVHELREKLREIQQESRANLYYFLDNLLA